MKRRKSNTKNKQVSSYRVERNVNNYFINITNGDKEPVVDSNSKTTKSWAVLGFIVGFLAKSFEIADTFQSALNALPQTVETAEKLYRAFQNLFN